MKLDSKRVGVLVVLTVVLALAVSGSALAWTDISDTQWMQTYGVTAASVATVADGYPDNTFRPNLAVNRGQFAKMSVNGLDVGTANPASPTFSDVPKSHIFFIYVEGASAARIVGGYGDGTFKPGRNITRQQSNSMLGKYLSEVEIESTGGIKEGGFSYPTLAAWYAGWGAFHLGGFSDASQLAAAHRATTAYLVYREVVEGSNGKLTPTATLTRAQAAVMILRTLDAAEAISTPPPAPTNLKTVPAGPASDPTPKVEGKTIANAVVAVYDTFGGSTTQVAQDTADTQGNFSAQITTPLVEGAHSFTAKAKNALGVISAASAAVTYVLDTTDPEGAITAPEGNAPDDAALGTAKPEFKASAEDSGAGVLGVTFRVSLNDGSPDYVTVSTDTSSPYQAVWPVEDSSYDWLTGDGLADGQYLFQIVVTDKAGNTGAVDPVAVTIDTKAPEAIITMPQATGIYYTEEREPLFSASAVDDPVDPEIDASGVDRVSFYYALKADLDVDPDEWVAADFELISTDRSPGYAANWRAAFPPPEVGLSDGHYVFAVQADDLAGNRSEFDSQEVMVDNLAPVVNVTAPTAGQQLYDSTPATITWTITDVSGVDTVKIEWSADGSTDWQVIVVSTDNDGSYLWAGPQIDSDTTSAKIRITAVDVAGLVVGDVAGHTTEQPSAAFKINKAPAPATGVTAADEDTVQAGLDGYDFTVRWTKSASTDIVHYNIYVLPDGATLQLGVDTAVATAAAADDDWTGDGGDTQDSHGAALDEDSDYRVWVTAEDGEGGETLSLPASGALWSGAGEA